MRATLGMVRIGLLSLGPTSSWHLTGYFPDAYGYVAVLAQLRMDPEYFATSSQWR